MQESPNPTFSSITPAQLRDLAVEMAVDAAILVKKRRNELLTTTTSETNAEALGQQLKSTECDPVTIVDQENEKALRATLAQRRPHDSILGEEGGGSVLTDPQGVTWVLDPIDGTVNFLYGIPVYSVSIAAAIGGDVVAGAVANIFADEIFSAHVDGGASITSIAEVKHDPTYARRAPRISCNAPDSLGTTLLGTGFSYTASKRAKQGKIFSSVISQVRDIRRLGSAALDLCFVAAGRLDAYYEHGLHPWDRAAGGVIAKEAGALTQIPQPAEIGHKGTLNYAVAPSIADDFLAMMDKAGGLKPMPIYKK